jgi:tRNA-intron endonuclease
VVAEKKRSDNAEEEPEEEEVEEEEQQPVPEEPVVVKLARGKAVITGEAAKRLYESGYYGSLEADGKLALEPEETLLLARRGRIRVLDTKGNALEFPELLQLLERKRAGLWTRYLVYSDLRSRGYVVRTGYGKGVLFRVYPRGAKVNEATAKYFVCAISEGTPLRISELETFSKQAQQNRKRLMLAVLDRQGETTYYLVSPAEIALENKQALQ